MNIRPRALLLFSGMFVSLVLEVGAQSTYSPYSRFAFGDVQSGAGSAQIGLGQLGAAWMDRNHLNTRNPAAAAFLTRTTFTGGFDVRSETILEGDSVTQGDIGGLTQVAFALKRAGGKGALTFGLQPWSRAGYDVSQIRTDDVADQYRISYTGNGGLAQAHMGYGRRWEKTGWQRFAGADDAITDSVRIITHSTALGARFEHRFGQLERSRTIDVANPIFLDTRVQTEDIHRSTGFTLGAAHERLVGTRFDKDRKLVASTLIRFGALVQLGRNHSLNRSTRWASWQALSTGPVEVDSVHSESTSFDIAIPLSWTAGIEIERNTLSGMRIRLGAEMEHTDWSSTQSDWLDPGAAFAPSTTLAAGFMLTPKGLDDADNGWQRSTYQLGWRHQTGYIDLDAGTLGSTMWSAGWSLPMIGSRSGSSLNLAVQWRSLQAGDQPNGLREKGWGATIGFTLHPFFKNQWLVPRKYD